MLRRHHDVATGTSLRRTYFRRLCDVSLVSKYDRPIWDVPMTYQLILSETDQFSTPQRPTNDTEIRLTSLKPPSDVLAGILRDSCYWGDEEIDGVKPKRNWPILMTNLNVPDYVETSPWRRNWYANKTDQFQTS